MTTEEEDDVIAKLSDYVDGATTGRAEIEAKLASDPDWKRLYDEMIESREVAKPLSGLRKAHAPVTFAEDVTGTIEKRSRGRFFARKTFGDRVPFGALLVIALIGLGAIGYVLWSSQTGSLSGEKGGERHDGSAQIVPRAVKRHHVYAIATAILLAVNAAIYYGWGITHGAGNHDLDVAFTLIAALQFVLATATIQSAWRKQSSAIVMGAILALILGLMSLLLGLFLVALDEPGKYPFG